MEQNHTIHVFSEHETAIFRAKSFTNDEWNGFSSTILEIRRQITWELLQAECGKSFVVSWDSFTNRERIKLVR